MRTRSRLKCIGTADFIPTVVGFTGEYTRSWTLTDAAGVEMTFGAEGEDAKVEVVGENRTLEAKDGRFADDFAPYSCHIYRIVK